MLKAQQIIPEQARLRAALTRAVLGVWAMVD
jgi:hypothetical protein